MMLPFLGPLAFLDPWILAGLVFLPVLWFLLRVTPPAPRRIAFPAARFLAGLRPEDRTASRTPWWILAMRLLAAGLIIVALARPFLHPSQALGGSGPVRLVIDNGWASARNWTQMMQEADDLANRAGQENRALYVMTTAPEPGSAKPYSSGALTKGQAEATLRGLVPRPWPADYTAAFGQLDTTRAIAGIHSFFLSHGVQDMGDYARLTNALETQGSLTVIRPDPAHESLLLRTVPNAGQDVEAYLDAPAITINGLPVAVEATGANGQVIDVQQMRLESSHLPQKIVFKMPDALKGQVTRIALPGRMGAGGVLLFEDKLDRKTVGIVSPKGAQATPLVDADFYLTRALSPYDDLHSGTVPDLLKLKPAVMILPDIGNLPPEELNALEDWVRQGGLLLRFAGPNMSQSVPWLLPVPLRSGGRTLNGAMTWQKPLHLAPFPETSPYHGLDVPADITIRQQLLAEPSDDLSKKTWAALEDGTPLITADTLGRGTLVMVHTTATPAWSDLALSGLFVELLRRTVNMAGQGAGPSASGGGALQPLKILDGFGAMTAPDSTAEPIPSNRIGSQSIDSRHPPGLYGRPGVSQVLNIGDQAMSLRALDDPPAGTDTLTYGQTHERDLMPFVLGLALIMFFADWLVMIALQAGWRLRGVSAVLLLAALLLHPSAAFAQNTDADAVKYAGTIYLAYIRSGDTAVDATTQAGLESLVQVLKQRTSVEPAGVVALDPEKDDLSFFPLIYWPVSGNAQGLSETGQRRIQNYLDHGGTILFDTADHATAAAGSPALQRIAGSLNIPPLNPMPPDHVLTRTFYLLKSEPGRYDTGTLWVEDQSASGRDGVSSVIVGGNDWAGEWATYSPASQLNSGDDNQAELSVRFGVNLVMYALTGNYKNDQIHLKQIMERLGQ
jgi:hypothetical protein